MNIVINLDKLVQMSSQQAVSVVKRLLGAKKAGHAGTLDPLATGDDFSVSGKYIFCIEM